MKIGLALSGGGAMGAAHAGVIEQIRKRSIPITDVCGTSAGAIVGLLYAGGDKEIFERFLKQMAQAGLFSKTKLLIKKNDVIFQTIEDLLRQNIKAKDFSDLSLRFSCVATDISTGQMVILRHGDPIKAVMASAAYPGVFPIQKLYHHFLVDGGLSMNLPAGVLKRQGVDFVIGSSLYSLSRLETLHHADKIKMNPLAVAIRSLDIISATLANYELKNCDYCFAPPIESFNWYDFDRIPEVYEIGMAHSAQKIDELVDKLSQFEHKKGFWQTVFGR